MMYAENLGFTASSVMAGHTWRINSCHDPDYSAVGHQPLGWDQYKDFYKKYRVEKIDYEITAVGNAAAMVQPTNMCVFIGTDAGAITSIPQCLELEGLFTTIPMNGTVATLRGSIDPAKYFGVSKAAYEEQDFSAIVGANPFRELYLQFKYGNPAAPTHSIFVWFKFRFHVCMFEPVLLAQS